MMTRLFSSKPCAAIIVTLVAMTATTIQDLPLKCGSDLATQFDRVAVQIEVELIGQVPQKVGDEGTMSVKLLPNQDMEDLLFSINTTSAVQVELPTDFERAESIDPFIKQLRAGDHIVKKIPNLIADRPDTFNISLAFTEAGHGYIMVGLRSPSEGKDVFFAESFLFFFLVTTEKAYFSYHSILDLNIQALRDSLEREGVDDEIIQKEIEKMKKGGAEVEKKIVPPGSMKLDRKSKSYNSVTVQGAVQFTDIIGGTHPVRFATVQIWDEEVGAADDLVATTTTDNSGNYSATFDDNDGDGTGRDIYVIVRAEGSTVQVEDYGANDNIATGNIWELNSGDPFADVADGSTLTIDITATNNDANPQNVAFEAYEAVNSLSRYLTDLGEPPPAIVTVRYPRPGTNGASYNPPNSWIRLPMTSVHDWDVIHHEYGHHIQQIYSIANNPGGAHSFNSNLCATKGREPGIRMSWAEGWPTFFGTMAQAEMNLAGLGIPNLGDTWYTDLIPAGNINYDLETFNAWSMGEGNEISTQRALWDLYDNVNDAGDVGVSMTAQELWDIVVDNQPHTFSAFWNYLTSGSTEAEKIAFGAICAQHNIAAELTGPADGTVYAGGAVPTFQWDGNLGCAPAANENYSVRFYNGDLTALIWSSPWQSAEDFTPNNAQRDNIFIGPDGPIQWIVASRDVSVPQTGVYYGDARTINDDFDVPDRNPVDIILALDISGSMNLAVPGSIIDLKKIELLKQAVEIFVRTWSIHAIDGDRIGIVYFSLNTSTMAGVPPFLKDVATNTNAIVADVLSKSAGSCTAIGGAVQVAYDNFDETSNNKRVIILFSDGEQTRNPVVMEEGSPAKLKIKTMSSSSSPPPFGGYWCGSQTGANAPDGSTIVPDGQYLHEHDVEIHTIGVGAVGAGFEELIGRIASETNALHHFTSAPDEDLDIFFTNDLINSLKTGTLELVRTDKGTIDKGDSRTLSIPVNDVAKSLTLVLSWKGELRTDALSIDVRVPGGSAVTPTEVEKSDFYTILHYDFPPTINQDTLNHWGNWSVRIISDTEVNTVPYQFSAIVDEPCLDYWVAFPRKIYNTGEKIVLTTTLTQNGSPLPRCDGVSIDITSPAQPTGNLLAECLPKIAPAEISKYKSDQGSELYPRQFDMMLTALLSNPRFAPLLKAKRTSRISLFDDGSADHSDVIAGDGIYSNIYTGTQTPGTYGFRYHIVGSSVCGKITRTTSTSAFVGINEFLAGRSLVKAFAVSDNLYNINVLPADRFSNMLGPGYPDVVQFSVTNATLIGDVNDRFNGIYDQLIQVEPGENPMVTVRCKGGQLHWLSLSDLIRRGEADTFPTPKIDRVTPNSGKPGAFLELTIYGTRFSNWANVMFFPHVGIYVEDIVVVSDTKIKAKIRIDNDATPGSRDLVVINPNGKGSTAKGVFTVAHMVSPIRFSVHCGAAFPIGSFADDYGPGFNVIVDLDYHISRYLSVVGLFGYNNFAAETVGIDDTYWINLSANLRYHQMLVPSLSAYVGLGAGVYIPRDGDIEYGGNAGIGVDYRYNPRVSFELGADYHWIFDQDIQFAHCHAGVICRF